MPPPPHGLTAGTQRGPSDKPRLHCPPFSAQIWPLPADTHYGIGRFPRALLGPRGGGPLNRLAPIVRLLNDALLRLMVHLHGLASAGAKERGQTLSEYGLMLTILAVGITVAAIIAFRSALMQAFASATEQFPP